MWMPFLCIKVLLRLLVDSLLMRIQNCIIMLINFKILRITDFFECCMEPVMNPKALHVISTGLIDSHIIYKLNMSQGLSFNTKIIILAVVAALCCKTGLVFGFGLFGNLHLMGRDLRCSREYYLPYCVIHSILGTT